VDIKEQIAVMQGFANGKEIEFRAPNEINDRWEKIETPLWDWHNFEYRIKPEPPIKITLWGIVSKKHGVLQMYHNKQDAINIHVPKIGQQVVKFICTEVPENAA